MVVGIAGLIEMLGFGRGSRRIYIAGEELI